MLSHEWSRAIGQAEWHAWHAFAVWVWRTENKHKRDIFRYVTVTETLIMSTLYLMNKYTFSVSVSFSFKLSQIPIICISICTFFLSLSPQLGFFRRRYREIIEAEKNRKDSDESWDWMEKNHWGPAVRGSQRSQWEERLGQEGSNGTGSRSTAAPLAPGPSVFHMWNRRLFSIFLETWLFFQGWVRGRSRKQASEVTGGLAVEATPIQQCGAVEWHPHPHRAVETTWTPVDFKTLRAVSHSKFIFIRTL